MSKKMNNKKSTKRTFVASLLSLMLCMAMFIGTTFAWFTDNVTSSSNIIKSGNLDLEMYWTDDLESGTWYDVEDSKNNTIFNNDNWEPGYTEVRYIKLVNAGNLALNYNVTLSPQGTVGKLADVINVYYINSVKENIESRNDLSNYSAAGLLKDVINGGEVAEGSLLAKGKTSPFHDTETTIVAIAMTMLTTAGNEYQDETIGDGFTVKATATQCPYEEDSFGDDYDANAEHPVVVTPTTGSVDVNGSLPAGGLSIVTANGVSAYIPEGVILEEGVEQLTLTVTPKDKSDSNITVVNQETLTPIDVHIDGIASDNETPITIRLGKVLPAGLNLGSYTLSHVENGITNQMEYVALEQEMNAHNQFQYDPATGETAVCMATFSEIAVVADEENMWNGTRAYDWYTSPEASEYTIRNADDLAGFGDIVSGIATDIEQDDFSGKTVKLSADINLKPNGTADNGDNNDLNFYPIGYAGPYINADGTIHNVSKDEAEIEGASALVATGAYGGSFCGIFDGTGHTIKNLSQNGWSMYSDLYYDNYYNEAMGLFGYIYDGTVKNLTLDNFNMVMEFAPYGLCYSLWWRRLLYIPKYCTYQL